MRGRCLDPIALAACPTIASAASPPIDISSTLIVVLLVTAVQSSAMAVDETAFFESKIRPVLAKHCYACHSVNAAKSGKLDGGLQ